jgi:hypothetical protein
VTQNQEWALLDEYARLVSLHESDLLWTVTAGHVTPRFGELPRAEKEEEFTGPDLFGEGDPFGEAPVEESQEGESE